MSPASRDHALRAQEAEAPEQVRPLHDAVVSFVLYQTDPAEVALAIAQVRASPGRHHVVLIDNTEPPMRLEQFDAPDVTIVHMGKNVGYGSGHNVALRRFAGAARYHLVLNTDLQFGPDVIPGLIAFMDTHTDVGLSMPLVRYPDGTLQHLCRLLPRPIDIFARAVSPNGRWAKALSRRYEVQDWSYDAALSFPFLSGCFMVLRPSALERAGLFDEGFFLFAEDLDLSRRLHRISRTVLCPTVCVAHEYRTRASVSLRRKWYLVRSFVRYFNKYGWFFDSERVAMNRKALAALPGPASGRA